MREVRVRERDEMRPHEEAGVDNGHVVESGILVYERPYDREVDIRRGELPARDTQSLVENLRR